MKLRLDAPTNEEYSWVKTYYNEKIENESCELAGDDDVDEYEHPDEDLALSLSWGGLEKFPEWIRENHQQDIVAKVLLEEYDEKMQDEGTIPENVCPCEQCKRGEIRLKIERKRKLDNYLSTPSSTSVHVIAAAETPS